MANNIRWKGKEDKQKISNLVRKFNTKVTKVSKQQPHIAEFQPQKLKVDELEKELKQGTRKDFNRKLKDLERYMKKGAEQVKTNLAGNTRTKYEFKNAQIFFNRIEKIKAQELAKLDISPQKGNVSATEKANLKPSKADVKNKGFEDFNKFMQYANKRMMENYTSEGYQTYKDNYLKSISSLKGLNAKDSELYKLVTKLNPETIFRNSINDPRLAIDMKYDDNQSKSDIYDTVLELWQGISE